MSNNVEHEFRELLKGVSEAPPTGTISLTGVLSRTPDANKFALTLSSGQMVMLDVDSVRGFSDLGSSAGQRIVRVDIDAARQGELNQQLIAGQHFLPNPLPWLRPAPIPNPLPWVTPAVPFGLATPHQALSATMAALQAPGYPALFTGLTDTGIFDVWTIYGDQKHPYQDRKTPPADGATGYPPYLD